MHHHLVSMCCVPLELVQFSIKKIAPTSSIQMLIGAFTGIPRNSGICVTKGTSLVACLFQEQAFIHKHCRAIRTIHGFLLIQVSVWENCFSKCNKFVSPCHAVHLLHQLKLWVMIDPHGRTGFLGWFKSKQLFTVFQEPFDMSGGFHCQNALAMNVLHLSTLLMAASPRSSCKRDCSLQQTFAFVHQIFHEPHEVLACKEHVTNRPMHTSTHSDHHNFSFRLHCVFGDSKNPISLKTSANLSTK